MEIRQLRYFVTLAEELHFGRAAQREHIVQSALSQQIRRLERDIGVSLLDRNTHQVRLTAGGDALLTQARQILVRLDLAAVAARRAAQEPDTLRVGVTDAGYELAPLILDELQEELPELEIHQVEAGVPEQYNLLRTGRLDVGIGCATFVPPEVASQPLRCDRVGVLVNDRHRLAQQSVVAADELKAEPILLADPLLAPEYNGFVEDLCRSAGFVATSYRGTVQSVRAAVDLIRRRQCVMCVPRQAWLGSPGVRWIQIDPVSCYPWSVLWRSEDHSPRVRRFVRLAHSLAERHGWLDGAEPAPSTLDRAGG